MTTYFQFTDRFAPGTRARSAAMNARFDEVVAAFANVALDITANTSSAANAIALATAASTSAAAALTAATNAVNAISGATAAANAAATAATAATSTANAALSRSGGAMEGPMFLSGNATSGLMPVTLQQMQAALAGIPGGGGGGGISSFNGRTASAAQLVGGDITALGSLVLNAPNSFQVVQSGQNVAGFTRSGAEAVLAENVSNLIDSFRIASDHTARIVLNNKQVFAIGVAGASLGGNLTLYADNAVYAMNNAAGTQLGYLQGTNAGDVNLVSMFQGINLVAPSSINFGAGGSTLLSLRSGRVDVITATLRLAAVNDGSFGYLETLSDHLAFTKKAGPRGFYWRRSADGTSGGAALATLASLDDFGSFVSQGLLYGRGGGMGLGQITVQAGGVPSGGADGDICLIV